MKKLGLVLSVFFAFSFSAVAGSDSVVLRKPKALSAKRTVAPLQAKLTFCENSDHIGPIMLWTFERVAQAEQRHEPIGPGLVFRLHR